jgi:hypothetical protein
LQDTTSLSARILKAIYYLNSDFLEAQLGDSPSQVWRAIFDGKEVLKQGIVKRIGDGNSTNIWEQN